MLYGFPEIGVPPNHPIEGHFPSKKRSSYGGTAMYGNPHMVVCERYMGGWRPYSKGWTLVPCISLGEVCRRAHSHTSAGSPELQVVIYIHADRYIYITYLHIFTYVNIIYIYIHIYIHIYIYIYISPVGNEYSYLPQTLVSVDYSSTEWLRTGAPQNHIPLEQNLSFVPTWAFSCLGGRFKWWGWRGFGFRTSRGPPWRGLAAVGWMALVSATHEMMSQLWPHLGQCLDSKKGLVCWYAKKMLKSNCINFFQIVHDRGHMLSHYILLYWIFTSFFRFFQGFNLLTSIHSKSKPEISHDFTQSPQRGSVSPMFLNVFTICQFF